MSLIWKLVGALGAGLAVVAAMLSLASQGGRFSERLDVLTHFAPVYALAGLLAVLLAALQTGWIRGTLLTAGLAGLASALWLMGPEILGPREQPRAATPPTGVIKIVQFNSWGRNARSSDAVEWILAQKPDVIFLQEGGRMRDALVRRGGYRPTCGHCASLILTRTTPTAVVVPSRFDREKAFVAVATLEDEHGPFTLVGVHRHWPVRFAQAARQAAQIQGLVSQHDRSRVILAGDFNSTPWSFVRRREEAALGLIRRTRMLPTWPAERVSHNRLPAPFPYLPIDHVYAGDGWETVSVERGPRLGSDHYPLVVTLAPTSR